MEIIISSEANMATPSAGYVSLFINTDKNNLLYTIDSNRVFAPFTGSNSAQVSELADAWMEAVSCSFKKGQIDAAEFESIMNQGLTVQSNTTTDDDGNVTTTLSVGSRTNTLVDITLDDLTVTVAVLGTHQIVTTFNPTNTSNQGLTYVTSDAAKATVSSTGLITGVATGSATITVIPAADPTKAKVVTVTIS